MTKTSADKSELLTKQEAEARSQETKGGDLEAYRSKRDPTRTNEPFAAERKDSTRETKHGRFVVHLHAATRTHYDLRLQIGGTLQSFAVPKGPSLDPNTKHLAVHTEDHPLEYLEFEAVIPAGNYGAGAMIVWDLGVVRYLATTAEEGLKIGKLDFELWGFKLKGRFALVHTGKRKNAGEENQWLLIKKEDAFCSKADITEQIYSVLSSISVADLPQKQELSNRLIFQAQALGAKEARPDFRTFEPMLCALSGSGLSDPDRLYELKLDGVRIVAHKDHDTATLRYRNGRSATSSYPEVVRAMRALAPAEVVLDGEIVTLDSAGRPNFQQLAPRIHARKPLDVQKLSLEIPVYYWVFDILAIGPYSLLGVPLSERKRLLAQLLPGSGRLRSVDYFSGQGQLLFDFCREHGLEGVVAKRTNSIYVPGPRRGEDWVKIKCAKDEDFVVVGWLGGKGSRGELGSLCVASYQGDRLVFCGRVGSGLDAAALALLLPQLQALETPHFPAHGAVPEDLEGATFTLPSIVVQVRFNSWTDDGRLRAPVFLGVRTDRDPTECQATPPEAWLEQAPETEAEAEVETLVEGNPEAAGAPGKKVVVSNRNKIFWPEEGYTKGDLCDYYASVAHVMLPFLKGRPVVLVRYPDGIHGKSFYQWNVPQGTPEWIRTLELTREERSDDGDGRKTVFLLDHLASLVHVANLGCIPLHVLACREETRDACDFLTVDFDVGERPFEDAVRLALSLRTILNDLGLVGFPKTSGQKGLHVLVPLGQEVPFDAAKLLVELLGRWLLSQHPDIATMERRISKRGPKVLIDVGQTGRSRTIVAPYSVRAYRGATVSTPLNWDEVHLALDPRAFTISSVPLRLAALGDPFASFFDNAPDLADAMSRMERKLRGG
ncbi:MAG: DNA ligase D [Polyangiaceae bacterium]|nr:DNA ligase D [Polyangiaceae bacterium]